MISKERAGRLNRLIEQLKSQNGSSIKGLAQEFHVSEMTVHRDLQMLEQAGVVSVVHGAVIFNSSALRADDDTEYHFLKASGVAEMQKVQIAKAAAKLVEPHDVIAIDVGSTTGYLAHELPRDLPVSVVCYTVNVLQEVLRKNVEKLFFGGGVYHPNTSMFESRESSALFGSLRTHKMFIGAAGVDMHLGLTCANAHEVPTKQLCMKSAAQKILLADSKKFDVIKPAYFASLEEIDIVVTDKGIPHLWRQHLEKCGIRLILS